MQPKEKAFIYVETEICQIVDEINVVSDALGNVAVHENGEHVAMTLDRIAVRLRKCNQILEAITIKKT